MTMDDDVDGFAAEYVLGTLNADERAEADALKLVDPGFAAKILEWERRLGQLNVLVAPVEPPPALWDRIQAGLASTGQGAHLHLPQVPASLTRQPAAPGAEAVDLTRRMRRWRGLAVITGTLAACFVGLVVAREYRPDMLPRDWRHKPQVVDRILEKPVEVVREGPRPAQFVAAFQKDEQSPAFLLTVDIDKKTVTIRQVAAEKLPDKTYQLWIATTPGTAPRSLGLVENSDFTVRAALSDYDPGVISNATYGISLEPLGGSPTGAPTGPVIHAKLFQATPPENP